MDTQIETAAAWTVQVTMLGSFRLSLNGHEICSDTNRALKQWNVLAYLIINRDRAISQAELIETFWADEDRANPASALKTLFHRLRALLDSLFPDGTHPILSQRGAYCWNPAIHCTIDAEEFETLCRSAANRGHTVQQRIALYEQALALYQGDFLPRLSDQLWVIPISTRYHSRYIDAVKACTELLREGGQYQKMYEISSRASELHPLDEQLHMQRIQALLGLGNTSAARKHYEQATDLIYRNLGVRPSDEMSALFREIMASGEQVHEDLDAIQAEMMAGEQRSGAFVCDYGFFQEIYRLEARRVMRTGACMHIALLTVSQMDGSVPPLKQLNPAMDHLVHVVASSLRRGDVVTRYGTCQYAILLPSANYEDSTMVMERIVKNFSKSYSARGLRLRYTIQAIHIDHIDQEDSNAT